MTHYISELDVSLDEGDEKTLAAKGFTKVNVNLNEGASDTIIYLWYKHGTDAITRVQLTFNFEMAAGLTTAGYKKVSKDLNTGADGDPIYLWSFKGHTVNDAPIVEIDVTSDEENGARKFADNWERLACDLNRGAGGKSIFAWVKREKQTYISDVTATESYDTDAEYFDKQNYIRVDEDTNRDAGGAPVFIWYRQTTDPHGAVSLLQISTNDREFKSLQEENYQQVKVDLNVGTGGKQIYLWYKKGGANQPIKGITLLNKDAVKQYEKAGLNIIKKNLNEGNEGIAEYLCINQ